MYGGRDNTEADALQVEGPSRRLGPGHALASDCESCGEGKYLDRGVGLAGVASVDANGGGNDEAGDCIDCVAGKYTANGGLSECATCASGKASLAGQSVCTACLPGQKLVGSNCVDCGACSVPAPPITSSNRA